jgi:hypothetical protein
LVKILLATFLLFFFCIIFYSFSFFFASSTSWNFIEFTFYSLSLAFKVLNFTLLLCALYIFELSLINF